MFSRVIEITAEDIRRKFGFPSNAVVSSSMFGGNVIAIVRWKPKTKVCARPDCGKEFPVTSKHKRRYCTQYCGHLESIRRNRKS